MGMSVRKKLAKDFHCNYKEIDAHVNFNFSDSFYPLKSMFNCASHRAQR